MEKLLNIQVSSPPGKGQEREGEEWRDHIRATSQPSTLFGHMDQQGENVPMKQNEPPAAKQDGTTTNDSAAAFKQFFLLWEVPVSQFEINEGLYKPKEPIFSQVLSTPLDKVSLFWQMSLAQGRDAAYVNLIYKTPGIPNLGISYNIHVLKKDGDPTELTTEMSQLLGGRGERAATRSSFVFANNMVKLRLTMKISQTLFAPSNIIQMLIDESRGGTKDNVETSLLGKNLWKQVDGANHYPPLADVKFLCRNKEIRFAHRAVLSAFSPKFHKVMLTVADQSERWYHIGAENIGGKTIREILYFIYHREVSPQFHFGRANEMLQAVHDLQQPAHLKFQVELRLANTISDLDSASKSVSRRQIFYIWSVAEMYDLKIVKNMIVTAVGGDKAKELHDFYEAQKVNGQLFNENHANRQFKAETEMAAQKV